MVTCPWAVTIVFDFLFWTRVFFTVGTLFGFRSRFDVVDALLEFQFQDFFEELPSVKEQTVVEIVDGLPEGGLVGDGVALGK
jgi:hypothetical protein